MKKSLTGVVVLLAGAFMAHSQGTVGFGNYTSFAPGSYMYVTLNGTKIGGASGNAGSATADIGNGNEWTVALYGAAGSGVAASSLQPLIDASIANNTTIPVTATLADGSSDSTVGTWYSGAFGAVPGAFNGGAATVQVYAWYNANGTITSYAMAQANEAAGLSGFSSTANVAALGGPFAGNTAPPGLPAALPGGMGNIALTSTVPEPSTIALGVMGASAFLMRLRKKQ